MGTSDEIRIRAGTLKGDYVDHWGHVWQPDRFFHGGNEKLDPKDLPGQPPDADLFQTMRAGDDFSYDIPVKKGAYELRLYCAEPFYRSIQEPGHGGENDRHFTVSLNGRALLQDFDITSDAGFLPITIRAFKDVVPATDGMIHLRFFSGSEALVNAIEIIPGIPGRMQPIRLRAGQSSYTDHDGNIWSADNYFFMGRVDAIKGSVSGTHDPDLYDSERYGNFTYAIPVPPGTYSVTLRFAETWVGPQGTDGGGIGSRVFNVSCNGTNLLTNFDIYKEAKGAFLAVDKTFHGLTPNGQGKLLINFSPVEEYAEVRAIEVIDESK